MLIQKLPWQAECNHFIFYFFRDFDFFSWKIPGATYGGKDDTVKMTQEIGPQIYKNTWTSIPEQLRK